MSRIHRLEKDWSEIEILVDIELIKQDDTFIRKETYNPLLKLGFESAWKTQQVRINILEEKLKDLHETLMRHKDALLKYL